MTPRGLFVDEDDDDVMVKNIGVVIMEKNKVCNGDAFFYVGME